MTKIKLAYIGNGKSANRYHIPFVLTRQDKFEIKKIYSRKITHDIWPMIPGVTYTENIQDVLNDSEIDMVVISLPPDQHYKYAKLVLESGKNCLCEKPFMETYTQAKEIFELAQSRKLFCSAYQNRRFDSDFLTVQKVIESGKLGRLFEVEMNYDYYRPEVPMKTDSFNRPFSFFYGHGCHTLDQVISYFGAPQQVKSDVRQLLGAGRMNDYFDIDLFYEQMKVSIRSSYFHVKSRPRFALYGMRGQFIKNTEDRQEEHLKLNYMPWMKEFGKDTPDHYGTLTYYDDEGQYHEEKISSVDGDYGRFYDSIYNSLVYHEEQLVEPWQTLLQMEILESGIADLN